MINGLTNVNLEQIDVRFNGIKRIDFAHNTIQVKFFHINSEGADIIAHIIDNFESPTSDFSFNICIHFHFAPCTSPNILYLQYWKKKKSSECVVILSFFFLDNLWPLGGWAFLV